MNPQHEPGDNSPRHQYPPGLEFLDALRRADQTEDLELKFAILWTLVENIRNFSGLMRQHGMDPDLMANSLQKLLEDCQQAQKEYEEGQDKLLHSAADLGDAGRNLVDGLEVRVNEAMEERPFDPQVQEWKEQLEELRKQYPKLD